MDAYDGSSQVIPVAPVPLSAIVRAQIIAACPIAPLVEEHAARTSRLIGSIADSALLDACEVEAEVAGGGLVMLKGGH